MTIGTGIKLSTPAATAKGLIIGMLTPRLAPGKTIDMMALDSMLKDVPEEGGTAMWPGIGAMVKEKFTPLLGQDATLDDVPAALGNLPPNAAPPAPVVAKPAQDASAEQIIAWLQANGAPPEMVEKMKTIGNVGAPAPGAPPAPPAPPPHADNAGGMDRMPKAALDGTVGEQKDLVTKPAMDAAITEATAKERERQRAIFRAAERVRPWVGVVDVMALDSDTAVYEKTLTMLGRKTDGLHPDALWPIIEAQPKPGSQIPGRPAPRLAADSAGAVKSVTEAFPGLRTIGIQG